jgi:hypothetical protein
MRGRLLKEGEVINESAASMAARPLATVLSVQQPSPFCHPEEQPTR